MTVNTQIRREACYIDRKWVENGRWVDVVDPANGEPMGRVPCMGSSEAEEAIGGAQRAYPGWSARSAGERADFLRRFHSLLLAHQEELATLRSSEQGKPREEARGEIAYTNLQETSLIFLPSGLTASLVANAAGSRSQGIEGNASFAITPEIRVHSDLTYLDAYYVDYPNGACTQAGSVTGCRIQTLSGKGRPFAPKFSGNFGIDLTIPNGSYVFTANPVAYFTTRYFQSATADPTLEQRGYTKFDARLGYGPDDKRWEIAFLAKNLLNEITASFRQPVTGSTGSVLAVAERGQSFAIQFTIKN